MAFGVQKLLMVLFNLRSLLGCPPASLAWLLVRRGRGDVRGLEPELLLAVSRSGNSAASNASGRCTRTRTTTEHRAR
jgi:hypothetical protein